MRAAAAVALALAFAARPAAAEWRYTRDLSDAELKRRWMEAPETLGSISLGFANRGRVINAVHMTETPAFIIERQELAWGTQETVDSLMTVFEAVHARFPKSAPARLSQIGAQNGGWVYPHRSHRTGQDADIGFFYKHDLTPLPGLPREKLIDPARNWALLRAVITLTDVQLVIIDRRIQAVLKRYALRSGEDPAWVERIFSSGLIQHEEKHRDHFHVRFWSPRARELGVRIEPLLPLRPEQNLAIHNVKHGETLGHIARMYRSTVAAIMAANQLTSAKLPRGEQLLVPLRGVCTRCPPSPAQVMVPPRTLPPTHAPDVGVAAVGASH